MTTGIIGAGIAGLSLGYFLEDDAVLFEKDSLVGGLCRSFDFGGIPFDVGPHIIFSKNKEVLDLHNNICEVTTHRRLNRIFLEGSYVKYPFENNLGSLTNELRDYCISEFINNPYRDLQPSNMQQFFLSYFGEGITDTYLYPYNKKIWKLDPSFLDLQMVERIPRPPLEDVMAGAQGSPKEGYSHQSVFTYPTRGGFQTLVDAYVKRNLEKGNHIHTGCSIERITRMGSKFVLQKGDGTKFMVDRVVSTIPLPELHKLVDAPHEIRQLSKKSMYNSIHIVMLRYQGDALEDQFALYIPDGNIIFHRLSRLNFLGENYGDKSGDLILMAEVTFRPDSYLSTLEDSQLVERCAVDLEKIGIVSKSRLRDSLVKTFPFAYVIYDLEHRIRTDTLISYFNSLNIWTHGRFGNFEYQNSDAVVEDSLKLSLEMNV